MDTPWRIQMFGGLRAERGEVAITHFRTQMTAALLAYLAHYSRRSHPREVLIELLWPEGEPESGRHNLRLALSALRRQFEPPGVPAGSVIEADRQTVQLNAEVVTTDVAEFEAALESAGAADSESECAQWLAEAVDLYRGEFLPGFYQDWVVSEQRRLADLYYSAVQRLTAHFAKAREWESALDCARRAVAVDPLREEAHCDLMRLLAEAGQPFAAVHQLRELERILKEELDVAPSDTTLELAREIERRAMSALPEEMEAPPAVLTVLVARLASNGQAQTVDIDGPANGAAEPAFQALHDLVDEFTEVQQLPASDGAIVLGFARPSGGVRFALLAQTRIRDLQTDAVSHPRLRIGIHLGEVLIEEGADDDAPRDILATQIAIATRLTELATGGQILMTRAVFDSAREIVRGEMIARGGELRWLSHGPYLLKGHEEPFAVCEVGEVDLSPLRRPADCKAGKSVAAAGAELVLGWRPAVDQVVPGTRWVIEKPLGEGGFGEVWLARHRRSQRLRVFKFCFRADRLRALKREVTLFRLLKEVLGERPDIARLYATQFEEAPYYLELEYSPSGDLAEWIEARGGLDRIPVPFRLEIVAQIAKALSAAHSVGVIHRDVKPSNVLVEERKDGAIQVRLTDFGIGELTDREALDRIGITAAGFTRTSSTLTGLSSQTGTRLYMAPELIAGRPPSIQSDIYSLGVLLYQLVIGDLSQPMTTDWERKVADPLLRDDVRRCLAGDPSERFSSGDELARALRTLNRRRADAAKREAAERTAVRRRRFVVTLAAVTGLFVLLGIALGYGLYREYKAHRATLAEKDKTDKAREAEAVEREKAARQFYYANIVLIEKAIEELRFDTARALLASCPQRYRNWEWGRLQYLCNLDLMTLKGHSYWLHCVAFSPDGKRLATGSNDATAKLWDVETGRELVTYRGHTAGPRSIAFSPDGTRIATGAWDTSARIWDVESGRELRTFGAEGQFIRTVAFSPDGKCLATADGLPPMSSTGRDEPIVIWDVETGSERLRLQGHYGGVRSLAFGPDGKRLASVGEDQTGKLWDLETGRAFATLTGHDGALLTVAFSPDGTRVATGSTTNTAKIWDARTGRELLTLSGHTYWVECVTFSPDGTRLATASGDDTAKVWEVETGREIRTFKGHSADVTSVAFSPDGKRLATASFDKSVKIWDVDAAREVQTLQESGRAPFSLAFSADSQWIATAGHDGTAKIWDADTGRGHLTLDGPSGSRSCVALGPNGKQLATGYSDGSVRLWDLETGNALWTVQTHNAMAGVTALVFSSDGAYLTTASGWKYGPGTGDNEAKIWDVETGRLVRTLEGHSHWICSVAFSPDGRRIATISRDGTAKIWDRDSGLDLLTISGGASAIAFSPDGRRIAGPAASIWDAYNGDRLVSLHGSEISVYSVAFSPDGKRLVTGGWDKMARIWDAETGREILTLKGHRHAVPYVAFRPDGKSVATAGGFDRTAILWPSFPWKEDEYPGPADVPWEERVEFYKRDYWKRQIAAQKRGVSCAMRIIDASTYTPGVPVRVKLELVWNTDKTSVAVVENVPAGWTVETRTKDQGRRAKDEGRRTKDQVPRSKVNGNRITWEIEPWTSPGVTLEYVATPPTEGGLVPVAFTHALYRVDSEYPSRIEDTVLTPPGILAFQQGVLPDAGYAGCRDAHILAYRPDNNAGGYRSFEEGDWDGGRKDHKKMLIGFDLSSVPSTFSLGRAELRLFAFGERRSGSRNQHTIYAARLLKPWNEGTGEHHDGHSLRPGNVTFKSAGFGLELWERPGALGVTDVADAESSATVGDSWPGWVTLDVTESVRFFLTNPSENHGWKVSQDPVRGVDDATIEYVQGAYMFRSSEATYVHLRPMLILIPDDRAAGAAPAASP